MQDDSASLKEEATRDNDPDFESDEELDEQNSLAGEKKESANASSKRKEHVIKFRAINLKSTWETAENDQTAPHLTNATTGEIELKHFILISLRKDVFASLCERETAIEKDEIIKIFSNVQTQKKPKNPLLDLLAQKQRVVPFSTNQDMHLVNNLSQLVGGEQQYYDQLQQALQKEEKGK